MLDIIWVQPIEKKRDFPGGPVVKKLPSNTGNPHTPLGTRSAFVQWEKNNRVDSSVDPRTGFPGDRVPTEGPGSRSEVFKFWDSFRLSSGGERHLLICDTSFSRLCQFSGKAFWDVLQIIYDPHTKQTNQLHVTLGSAGLGFLAKKCQWSGMTGVSETLRLDFCFLCPVFFFGRV